MLSVRNLRIGQRMAIGFTSVIALMVVLTLIGIHRVHLIEQDLAAINEVNSVKQRYAINFRGSVHDRAIALRDVVLSDEASGRSDANRLIVKLAGDYARSAEPLALMIASSTDQKEVAMLDAIRTNEASTLPLLNQVATLRESGDVDAAKALMLNEAGPAFVAWLASINAFIDWQEAKSGITAKQLTATAHGFAMLMVAATIFALALGTIIAVVLTRSISQPMRAALSAANDISEGKLDNALEIDGKDEASQLLAAMEQMRRRIRSLISELTELATRHEAGEISYRMDPARHPGDFGVMVRDTNAIIAAHMAVKLKMVHLAGRYAIGDLSEDMERLPGEKAIITRTMDEVKENLSSISQAVHRLSLAASEGDFAARGEPEKYEHSFRQMIENLNRLMESGQDNLSELSEFLNKVASGDLDARMVGDFKGVFATMGEDANKTAANLAEIVRGIHSSSESITGTALELSRGNRDLSQRTEQQAASLQETAASMEELTSTVRNNASSAHHANRLSMEAAATADQGRQIVGEVVATMQGIQSASRRISDITTVIDGIAFQTNILALNAAVEAARAGEQGRGFAVVASEVRTLAHRAASSAKEIKELIDDSAKRINEGSTLVQNAGSTMEGVVESVHRVTDIMQEIAAASKEQASSIEQVNAVVGRMDEATQQNAALVEEAAAAATGLQSQASGLRQAIAAFKVEQTGNPRHQDRRLKLVTR